MSRPGAIVRAQRPPVRETLLEWTYRDHVWRLTLCPYNGQYRLDLRQYFFSEKRNEWMATRKGLVIPPAQIGPLIAALTNGLERITELQGFETGEGRRRPVLGSPQPPSEEDGPT